jgi:FtsH-binding integral membrane protein
MTWIQYNWLKLLAIAFLVGALQQFYAFPFAYYQFMNWIVVGASLVTAQQANVQNKMFAVWLFLLVAVTFNPIAPMYFRADVWQVTDLVAIALFIISFIFVRQKKA